MNIRFNSVDIENFRSIEHALVQLDNQGTVIVKGINEYEDKATSNGSGKSSVFEAIIFAIFEETSSGEKDVANRIINNGYTITLKFEIDNNSYTIVRQSTGSKTNVVFYENGNDISARNKTDTNKLIIQKLGISKAIFLDSIFLSQSANTNLASLTPTARKERLEILTNTDASVNEFKDKLKEQQLVYESKCVENQMTINKLNGNIEAGMKQKADLQLKINQVNAEIERLKQLGTLADIEAELQQKEQVQMVEIQNGIDKLTSDIQAKEQEVADIRAQGENDLLQKDSLERQKQEKLNEWNTVNNFIENNNTQMGYSERAIKKTELEIDNIKNSDKCPTCGRKLEDADDEHIQNSINKLQTEIQTEQENIATLKQENAIKLGELQQIEVDGRELNNQIIQVSAVIEEHRNRVNAKDQERKDLLNQQQMGYAQLSNCQREINELNSKKEQLLKTQVNNIAEFEEMIDKTQKDIEAINEQIVKYMDEYTVNDNYVSVIKNSIQMVTKEFRTYLLQNSLQYLNRLLAQYSSQLFSNEGDIIKIEEDDTKLNIKLGNATYESLSGGEKTRVNIALLLAQKSLAGAVGNISCNIIILDEILGYCDSQAEENVIKLLTQELETLESIYMVSHKEIPIGYDTQLTIVKDKSGLSRVLIR